MQTATSENIAGENFGVARVTRRVLNANSYIGGILTSRTGGGTHELTYGIDGNVRLRDQVYLALNFAQSYSDDSPGWGALDRSLAQARFQRRTTDGFTYALDASRVGAGYDPAMGFQLRRDYIRIGDQIGYGWRPGRASSLLRHALSLNGYVYRSVLERRNESARVGPEWVVETKSGHQLTIAAAAVFENLRSDFSLSPTAIVPRGSYDYRYASLAYRSPQGGAMRYTGTLDAGSFFDGSVITARVAPTWIVSRNLELGGTYQHNRIELPERNQHYRASVFGLRARAAVSTSLSATGFFQYSDAADALSGNLRIRFNPKEGNDLYIVYNLGANTDRFAYSPIRPKVDSQVLLIKYAHTFDLGF